MRISVRPINADGDRIPLIEALLKDTADHIAKYVRIPLRGIIEVQVASNEPKAPITLNRNRHDEPIRILLSAHDQYWCQCVFQFAHEFCHVLSGCYEELMGNPNAWLHETVCEIASIFTLRRMADQWHTAPTAPGRQDYAEQFQIYSDERLGRQEVRLPTGLNLPSWLKSREKELRTSDVTDEYQRLNQSLIAYILLPIFERNPEGWNAVMHFPTSTGKLSEYLADWHSSVEADDKHFVTIVSDTLGYRVGN